MCLADITTNLLENRMSLDESVCVMIAQEALATHRPPDDSSLSKIDPLSFEPYPFVVAAIQRGYQLGVQHAKESAELTATINVEPLKQYRITREVRGVKVYVDDEGHWTSNAARARLFTNEDAERSARRIRAKVEPLP